MRRALEGKRGDRQTGGWRKKVAGRGDVMMLVDVRAGRRAVGVQRLGWRRKVWVGKVVGKLGTAQRNDFVSAITRESLGGPTG